MRLRRVAARARGADMSHLRDADVILWILLMIALLVILVRATP